MISFGRLSIPIPIFEIGFVISYKLSEVVFPYQLPPNLETKFNFKGSILFSIPIILSCK